MYEKMVKIWKRSLSMLLAVMMIFSMMPMQAIAAELEEIGTDDTSIVEPETPEEEPEVPEEEPEEPEEPEHTCEFSAVVTDPTCTEGGYTTYTCECGEVYTADEVEALGHSFEEGTCTACGAADPDYEKPEEKPTEEPTDAPEEPEHTCEFTSVVTDPTCTEGGYTTYTCTCGETYTADEVEALGHSFEEGTCTVCGEEDPDYQEELSGETRIIYFHNAEGWEEVYAAWSFDEEDFEDVEFPGEKMKDETELEDVWFVELPVEADDVLFSDGIEVTEELLAAEKEAGLEVIHEIAAELETKLSKDLYQNEEWTNYEDEVAALEEEEETEPTVVETEPPVMDKAPEAAEPTEVEKVQAMIDDLATEVNSQDEYDALVEAKDAAELAWLELSEEDQNEVNLDNFWAAQGALDAWDNVQEEAGSYDEATPTAEISNTDPAWRSGANVIEVYSDASSVKKATLYSLIDQKWDTQTATHIVKQYGGFKYNGTLLDNVGKVDAVNSANLATGVTYNVSTCTVTGSFFNGYKESWKDNQGSFTVEVYDILTVNTTINGATTTDQYKVFRGKTHSGTVAPKTGYDVTVTGATTYDAATGAFTVSGLSADADVNITYTPKNYTATWKVGEGTWADGTTADKTSTVAYGAVINAIEDEPKREGYSFIGWDGLEDGETMPAENVSFTAKYDAKPVKRIVLINKDVEVKTFNVYYEDGETVAVDGMTVKHLNEKGEELGSYAVTDDLTNNEKFVSWVVSADGLTYTADWDPDTNNNDVADSAETITVNFENATVQVDGKDANNGVAALYDSTKGTVTIVVTPSKGYYVEEPANLTLVKYEKKDVDSSLLGTDYRNIYTGTLTVESGKSYVVDINTAQPAALVLPVDEVTIKVNGYTLTAGLSITKEQVLDELYGAGNYTADHYSGSLTDLSGIIVQIGKSCNYKITYNTDSAKYPDVSDTVTVKVEDSREKAKITNTYVNGTGFDTEDDFKKGFAATVKFNDTTPDFEGLTDLGKNGEISWTKNDDGSYKAVVKAQNASGWLETTETFDDLTWTVNQYTVTFVDEDDSVLLAGKKYNYGTPAADVELPAENPTKTGYTFDGWTVADVTADATYKATYTINKYTYTVNTYTMGLDGEYGEPVAAPQGAVEYGTPVSVTPVIEPGFTLNTEKSHLSDTIPANDDLVLNVYIDRNKYDVVWNWKDAEGVKSQTDKGLYFGAEIVVPTVDRYYEVEEEGTTVRYYFKKWDNLENGATVPVDGITYTAVYDKTEVYEVAFNTDGGTSVQAQYVENGLTATEANAVTTREGYRFDGWYLGETKYDFATPVTGDITLTAKWVQQVTVSFEGAEVEAQTFDINGTAIKPADPTKDQAIFGGWYLGEAEEAYDFATPVTEDITLTAKWIADLNRNNVPDTDETITIKVTKANDADVFGVTGAIEIENPDAEEGVTTYVFDTNNPTITITATPVVTDGISTTYVKSIGAKGAAELSYTNFVATETVEVKNGDVIEVIFEAVPVLKETPDVVEYNFFTREIPYDAIYGSVVEAPALVGENTTYTYFARPAMTHTVTIDSLDLDASVKTILNTVGIDDFSFDMEELWLPLDAEIEESVSLETAVSTYLTKERLGGLLDKFDDAYDAAYDAYIAANGDSIIDKGLAAAAGAKAGAEAVTADITDIYNTVYASAMYYGAHEFGYNADGSETVSEQIKIEYNDKSMHWTADATVVLKDSREVSYITGSDMTLIYRDYLDEDILANFTLTDKDGNPIEGEIYAVDLTDPYTFEGKNVSETAYELTVKFAGNENYRRAEKTVNVTVVKAGLSIDLPNLNITYGDTYDIHANVSTANKYGDKQEVIDSLVEIIIGLDVANLDVSEDGKVTGADAHVQIMLPKDDTLELLFKTLGLDIYSDKGEVIDFAQLQDILGKLDGALGEFDSGNETVDGIVNVLESVTGLVDLSALKITFGGTYPTDVGVYLYGAVSTSANYETAYDVAYMLIKPQTTEYTLDWNDPALTNAVVTLPMFNDMDKGAHVVEAGAENLKASYVILGVNTDTSDVLSTEIYENVRGNVWLSPDEIKENGAYLQIAYGIDWGNEFDYAMPIVRAFAVVPALYDVQLVGATGTPNDELLKEFNNEPQGFSVIVKNDNGEIIFSDHYQNVTALKDNAQLIVNYTGVQTNGKSVNLTTILNKDNKNEPIAKPVHAGVYAVTAFYMELNGDVELDVENLNVEDLYKLFDLADAGMDAGLLVIEPAESTVDVEEKIVNYNSETDILFKNMVKAGSAVEGLKPDTTIISAGIDTDAAFSESGWDAVRGIVNVDFPAWIDELLDEYAPGVKAGMSVADLKDVLLNKLPDISDKLIELGATEEMVNSLANLTGNVASVLAELPDNIRLSFIDDAKANEIGAYIVTAVVTDSDHYPSVDSGYLIVLPDVDMFELKWNYEDGNGIFTRDLLQHVDLLAKAYDAKSGAYNEDATGEISYMFVGIDSNGEFKHYTDPATLPNGAYIELAYIELDVEGEMIVSDMIARPIVVVASNCKVNVESVETVFDNTAHGVKVTVTDLEGREINTANGTLTVLYAGLQTNGKAYLDTKAPVHAGVYEALVTYTENVNGELRYYGTNVGYVMIDLAESEIAVTGKTVTYDGKGHTAQVEITKGHPNADYTLISGGAYVSGDINEVGLEALHGNVNIDLPRWLDEALAEYEFTDGVNAAKLADYIEAYRDELVAAVKDTKLVDWNLVTEEQVNAAVEKLNAYIDELVAVLKKLPTDVALTFESDITYTEPGYYFYYGIVTDSDHYPSTADADWKILPAMITSVEVVGEYTYNGAEQTVELLVKAGDMIVNAGDYKVTGNTATDAGEYTVTISGIGNFAGVMDAKWTINKRAATITITPETATMVAGNAVPEFGATVEGTVNGDELNYTITTVDGKTAGEFSIGAELGNNPNYDVTVVPATLVVEVAVARINDVYYAKLSDAIAEVKNGETIVLLTTIGENVTIKQTAGKSFSIDGNGQTYTGTITIDGNKRSSGAETLTIENTNFVISGEWTSSIATSNQAHNITVDSCTFTGTDKGQYGIVLSHAHNVKVENTTGTELYDLVYGKKAVTGFTAENVKVTNSKNGIWLSYVNSTATFKNLNLDVTEVGVGIYNNAKGTATFEDNTIKAETPVYLGQRNDQTKNFTLTFNGTNNLSSTDENGALIFVSGTDPVFKAVMNDTSVNMDQTKGLVAKIGNVYYNTLQHAVDAAKDGETVIVVADHEIECDVNPLINVAGKNITIDLNGKKITANAVAADATRAIFKTENGAKLTVKDTVGTGSVVANGDGVLHYMFRNEGEMIIESGNFTLAAVNGGGMFYSTNDNMQVTGGNFTQTTNGWMFNTEGNSEHVIPVTGGTYNRYFIGGASVTPQENTRGEVVIPEQYGLRDNKNGTWTVVHRVVVVFDDVTVSYGETPNFTYTIKDYGWTGYNVTVETPVVDAVNAGVYENVITAKATVNDDFVVDVDPGTLTINKAEITVTVDDVTIAVDDKIPAQDAVDPAPKLTYTVTVGNATATGADLEALIAKLSDELKVEITATVEQNDAQQNIPGTYENDVKYVESDNYVVTVVKGNVIVELRDYICWNMQTGVYYKDVSDGLMATTAGQTLQMLKDATASFNGKNEYFAVVPYGATFDLNGHYVEVDNMYSYGVVMDSALSATETVLGDVESEIADGTVSGGIMILNDRTKEMIQLQPANGNWIPIYDVQTGSYKFFNTLPNGAYTSDTGLVIDSHDISAKDSNSKQVKFRFRLLFEDYEAYNVLIRSGDASGLKVKLDVQWTGVNAFRIEYTMPNSDVRSHATNQVNYAYTRVMYATLLGLDSVGSGNMVSAVPFIETDAGVTIEAAEDTAAQVYIIP